MSDPFLFGGDEAVDEEKRLRRLAQYKRYNDSKGGQDRRRRYEDKNPGRRPWSPQMLRRNRRNAKWDEEEK